MSSTIPSATLSGVDRPAPPATAWVILPTYNERENLGLIVPGIRAALPDATILVVDDPHLRVLHRTVKEGLAKAYAAGFAAALEGGADLIVQMDADGSHDPSAVPAFLQALEQSADLVLGSRYVRGGRVVDWPLQRRFVSLGGKLYAQAVLWLPYRDLTGGFKAWRAETLRTADPASVTSSGYVFQVELTWRAHRAGSRIRELPITFVERQFGQSKMTGRIFLEAARQVLRLRLGR